MEYRQALDSDLEKIAYFLNSNKAKKENFYVKKDISLDMLKQVHNLRPMLFEGDCLFFVATKNDIVEELAMLVLPAFETKSTVLDIFMMSMSKEFSNEVINYIHTVKNIYNIKKIRLTLVGEDRREKMLELGYKEESFLQSNAGLRFSLIYLL